MKSKGFTFLEILFVILAIGILTATISPYMLNHLEEARRTKTEIDLDRIVILMTNFQWDNNLLPRSNGTSQNDQSLEIVFLGNGQNLPEDNLGQDWKIEAMKKEVHFLRRDLYANHLVHNDPNNNKIFHDKHDYRRAFDSKEIGWKGPYLDSPTFREDSWGSAYMISFFKTHNNRLMGKVVSAGPNKKLEVQPFSWSDEKETEILKTSDDYIKYFQKF